MPRLAKIRIVGTIAAIPRAIPRLALPLAIPLTMAWFGTATSQSTIVNDQSQSGAVTASQTLDVVTNSSDTTAFTTSTANSFVGSVVTGTLNVQSTQQDSGPVAASTTINVAASPGPVISSFTAATGNSGSSMVLGGAGLTGSFLQTATGPTVGAESQIFAANATTADASLTVQAVANSQEFGAEHGAIQASVTQSTSSTTAANGGVVFGNVTDQGAFTAIGAGNNLTSVGQAGSFGDVAVNQTNTGQVTQGAMFANFGQSEVTATSAIAAGNNANITNTEGDLIVSSAQDNQSFVHGQAVETSFEYGGAAVSAEAVGNSMVAGEAGPSLALSNVQLNGVAGVESSASFEGNTGFDASVNATATGNAAAGFACSVCGGVVNVANSQTNLGDVGASTQLGVTGSARSVRGVATAVGNTASFYVSQPN
jgi:hypothetical protein